MAKVLKFKKKEVKTPAPFKPEDAEAVVKGMISGLYTEEEKEAIRRSLEKGD